ncbi:MAG: hypothetical protein A3I78_07845 [Gammaproteobacteria bacterium RIFCSPLOWO2_02_FULL_56_15]|nr:MAG: hypothetical protein A3I78_07845 [Gammaproteobacteria bacterium RIFCSPLOWO2_02_FULL_56_15]
MLKSEKVEDFFQDFLKMLPEDLRVYRQDLMNNIRAALNGAFARMDLVTREEFDIQSALLAKTRLLVDELEKKIGELEQHLPKDTN